MRFSENGLYVECYIKCGTCGVLIYGNRDQELLIYEGIHYCSQWCIDWKKAREARRSNLTKTDDQITVRDTTAPIIAFRSSENHFGLF
jgi:hypothetical protein